MATVGKQQSSLEIKSTSISSIQWIDNERSELGFHNRKAVSAQLSSSSCCCQTLTSFFGQMFILMVVAINDPTVKKVTTTRAALAVGIDQSIVI